MLHCVTSVDSIGGIKMVNTRREKTLKLVQISVLIAIIFVMAFTPLGYFQIIPGGASITLLPIPVIIGAVILGPGAGALLGGVFGLTSLITCFGLDHFGTALFGVNPLFTAILCFVPRILMGLIVGLVCMGLSKVFKGEKSKMLKYPIACIFGAPLNTALFVVGLSLMFSKMEGMPEAINTIITTAIGVNGVIEAIACFVVGTAAAIALDVFLTKSKMK